MLVLKALPPRFPCHSTSAMFKVLRWLVFHFGPGAGEAKAPVESVDKPSDAVPANDAGDEDEVEVEVEVDPEGAEEEVMEDDAVCEVPGGVPADSQDVD